MSAIIDELSAIVSIDHLVHLSLISLNEIVSGCDSILFIELFSNVRS